VVVVIATAVTGTTGLVLERAHYRLFYQSKYDAMVDGAIRWAEDTEGGTLVLLDAPPEVLDFLFRARGRTLDAVPHIRLRDAAMTTGRLDSLLASTPAQRVFLGQSTGTPAEQLARVQLRFPHLAQRIDLAEGGIYLLY